jgi:hypothetical protein
MCQSWQTNLPLRMDRSELVEFSKSPVSLLVIDITRLVRIIHDPQVIHDPLVCCVHIRSQRIRRTTAASHSEKPIGF